MSDDTYAQPASGDQGRDEGAGATKTGSPCAISAITEGRCEAARQLLSCLIPGAGGRLRRLLGPLFRGKLLLHLRVTAPVSFG
jgi:hypothetical protein